MHTWLLQRLSAPIQSKGEGPLKNAHRVFGGGMLGLSEVAWDVLDQIWDIDYMGAAEFEFGELPKCLTRMIKAKDNLERFEVTLTSSEIRKDNWRPVAGRITKKTVYVIAPKHLKEDVIATIKDLAKDKVRLKEYSMFHTALLKEHFVNDRDKEYIKACGWIDIKNDYMFFTSEKMFKETDAVLFGGEFK
jgi:hypothetical protein